MDDVTRGATRRARSRRIAALATACIVFVTAGALLLRAADDGPARSTGSGPAAPRIAYVREGAEGVGLAIDGHELPLGGVRPVAGLMGTWSPDGQRFAFPATDGTSDPHPHLWIIGVDGTDLQRLTSGPGSDIWPSFDPTGTRVAFVRTATEREPELIVVDPSTGVETVVPITTDVPAILIEAHWAGGDALVALMSGVDGGPNRLMIVHLDGSAPSTLYVGSFNEPSSAPDGADVVMASQGVLWAVPTDGSPAQELVQNLDRAGLSQVAWAPVGSRILYTVPIDPTAGEELWIIDATSGARRRLATGLAWRGGSPAWSPDATAIAFERDGDIWSVDLATGTETRRTRTDDREPDPAWGASPSRSTGL